jgi:hypothetical protein
VLSTGVERRSALTLVDVVETAVAVEPGAEPALALIPLTPETTLNTNKAALTSQDTGRAATARAVSTRRVTSTAYG